MPESEWIEPTVLWSCPDCDETLFGVSTSGGEILASDRLPSRQIAEHEATHRALHECGYPEDSFACKIRHIHLDTSWAKKDH